MTALLIALTPACGRPDSWVLAAPAAGWPAQYADAANSSYTGTGGAQALKLRWSRSVKGSLAASVALGSSDTNYLAANGQTAGGCSLAVWEFDNDGRQRWCTRLVLGGGFASALFDRFDNLYVGQPGTMLSFPPTQWVRWRHPVIGMPLTPRFVADNRLLMVTHLGQAQVLDAHRGTMIGSAIDMVAGVDPLDSTRGLTDCQPAGPRCPIAAAPAFSAATGQIVIGVWQPGAPTATLAAVRYRGGDDAVLSPDWTTDAVKSGVIASPVFSGDGATVYVTSRDGNLWALNAKDGKPKWSVPLGFSPQTPPTVAPDGLILSGGGPDTKLVAVREKDGKGAIAWRRDDVNPLSTSSQAGRDIAYTVIRSPNNGLSLLAFQPTDGRTVNTYPLPQAVGWPVGVSVASDRRVLTATSEGQVYGFDPA
jgi:outer membrane protein assembly factor BamB